MAWERIKALFRKWDESEPDSLGQGEIGLPHPRRTLAEILDAQQPKNAQESVLALRPLTVPPDSPSRAELQDFVLALEHAARGEHLQAIEGYSSLISARLWIRASVHFARGDSYAALGRYKDAIADYEVPLRDFDVPLRDEFTGRWGLFSLCQESGQAERAIRILRELADVCTRLIEHREEQFFFYQRALAHAGLKEYSKAVKDCKSALNAPNRWRQADITGYGDAKGQPAVDQAHVEELQAAILAETNVQEHERA